jgi:hypothetical protein
MQDGRRRDAIRGLCALLALSLAAAIAASASGATARPAAVVNCPLPHYPGVGYFTSLTVSGTSCRSGKAVAIAYYHCRLSHGGVKGRCPGGVLGFSCAEHRVSIPTEIDARVTCTKGRAKVVHTYQQDT